MSPDIAVATPIINMELTAAAAAAAVAAATNSSAVTALRSHFPLHYPPPALGQTAMPTSLPPPIYANNNVAMIYGGGDGNSMVTPILYSSALHAAHAANYLSTLPSLPPSPLSPNDPHGIQHSHNHTHIHNHNHTLTHPNHPEHHHLQHHPFSNAYLKIMQTTNDCNHLYNGVGTLTPLINGSFMTPPTPPTTISKTANSQPHIAATTKTTMTTPIIITTTTTSATTIITTTIAATTQTTPSNSLITYKTTVTTTLTPTSAPISASISRTNLVQSKPMKLNEEVNINPMNMSNDSTMIGIYTKGTQLYGSTGRVVGEMENHVDLECNASTLQGYFKIPNNRESSGKQRLIKSQQHNQETNDINRTTMRTCNSTGSFKKGAYIELSNGSLRRVEDMRTEDFIQCAERSPHHRLIESTVVKINSSSAITTLPQQQSSTVMITFSYDRNRSKADIEVSPEHPFFVYGQGWASYNPDMTMTVYNLKCQRLQVGDICISLTKREIVQHNPKFMDQKSQQQPTTTHYIGNNHNHQYGMHMTIMPPPPASDSRYYFNSAATNAINLNSNPTIGYMDKIKMLYQYPYAKHVQFTIHERLRDAEQLREQPFYNNPIVQLQSQLPEQEAIQQILRHNNSQSLMDSNRYLYLPEQDQPLDVSISRKRRWSAPEHTLSDNNNELEDTTEPTSPLTRKKVSISTPAPALPTTATQIDKS